MGSRQDNTKTHTQPDKVLLSVAIWAQAMALPRPPALQGALEEVQATEAVQSFHAAFLGLALGERVSVRHRGRAASSDKGWLYGTTIDGRQGWFPSGAVAPVCREVAQPSFAYLR